MVKRPIAMPPKTAAVGMYLTHILSKYYSCLTPMLLSAYRFKMRTIDVSRCPLTANPCSRRDRATSFGELPDTEIQVRENIAQVRSTKRMYVMVWIGSLTATHRNTGIITDTLSTAFFKIYFVPREKILRGGEM